MALCELLRCGRRLFLGAGASSLFTEEASVVEAVVTVGDDFHCVLILWLPGPPEAFVEFDTGVLIELNLVVVGRPMLDSYRIEDVRTSHNKQKRV